MLDQIIYFFDNISSTQRGLILALGITGFWIIEGFIPFRVFSYNKFKHAITNILLTLTTIIVNFSLAFLIVISCDYVSKNEFGLISILNIDGFLRVLLSLMILDFIGAYLAHYVQHKIKPLWLVHAVHHSDKYVDTTTANRHHPIESLVRFIFTVFAVFVSESSIAIVFLYQSLSVVFSQFNHANIKLNSQTDKIMSYLIVTPDMHKVHHHSYLPYTDTNYGNIFSIWDRLFGTYSELDKEKIIYGIDDNYDDKNDFFKVLKRPFKKD